MELREILDFKILKWQFIMILVVITCSIRYQFGFVHVDFPLLTFHSGVNL